MDVERRDDVPARQARATGMLQRDRLRDASTDSPNKLVSRHLLGH